MFHSCGPAFRGRRRSTRATTAFRGRRRSTRATTLIGALANILSLCLAPSLVLPARARSYARIERAITLHRRIKRIERTCSADLVLEVSHLYLPINFDSISITQLHQQRFSIFIIIFKRQREDCNGIKLFIS